MVLTDEDLKKLYVSKDFPGSFSGMSRMKHFIEQIYEECIPLSRLYRVMKELPQYIYQITPVRNYKLRSYEVDGFAQLLGKLNYFKY